MDTVGVSGIIRLGMKFRREVRVVALPPATVVELVPPDPSRWYMLVTLVDANTDRVRIIDSSGSGWAVILDKITTMYEAKYRDSPTQVGIGLSAMEMGALSVTVLTESIVRD